MDSKSNRLTEQVFLERKEFSLIMYTSKTYRKYIGVKWHYPYVTDSIFAKRTGDIVLLISSCLDSLFFR